MYISTYIHILHICMRHAFFGIQVYISAQIYIQMCLYIFISVICVYILACPFMSAYIHVSYMHAYIYTCVPTYIHIWINIYSYICCGNKYVPYYDRVLMFWQENPSLLDYDDVIMLCCC